MSDLGCFGMPSVFNAKSEFCKRCHSFERCRPTAEKVLATVSKRIPLHEQTQQLLDNYVVGMPSRTMTERVLSAPKKVQARLRGLLEQGFDRRARYELGQGRDPFPASASKEMHEAVRRLLAGGFTRQELRDWCIQTLGWTQAAAASQVSNTIALLRGLALIQDGEVVTLAKN